MKTNQSSGWRTKLPCVSGHKHNLSAYLDGELDLPARAGVERHLADCRRCAAECEHLRFASRAASHLIVPEVRVPDWRDNDVAVRRRPQPSTATMEGFWTARISVPAPIAAAVCLALMASVSFLLLWSRQAVRTPALSTAPEVAPTQIKFIEVPVEREVVRERVVTRTRFSPGNERSLGARSRGESMASGTDRISVAPENPRVGQKETEGQEKPAVIADLAEFTPATNARLRPVKEPER